MCTREDILYVAVTVLVMKNFVVVFFKNSCTKREPKGTVWALRAK